MIRKTEPADLDAVMEIYAFARAWMKANGNPNQWGDSRPSREAVAADIEKGNSYVIVEDGKIIGVFALILGPDPTYSYIEGGEWLNDAPYGTIHRLAADGTGRNIFSRVVEFAGRKTANLRADTHEDNRKMQALLEREGFVRCGIIYLESGSPRIAYHRAP